MAEVSLLLKSAIPRPIFLPETPVLLGQNTEMPGKMTGKQCPIAGSLLPRMSNTVPTPHADISFDRVRHDFSTT
jgi:hypothetical protein